jgi:hypothetical protein
MEAVKMKEVNAHGKEQWSTYLLMQQKLVVHVLHLLNKMQLDDTNADPDGIPTVWLEMQRAARVRRMTDAEFEQYFKQYGMVSEIKLDMVYVPTEEEKKGE